MDKRQEKSINAIYNAFAKLINEKDYDDITIQDLLEKAASISKKNGSSKLQSSNM